MKFQERDSEILRAIYDSQGIMAKRQLKTLFWPDSSWRAMEQRLAKLYRAEYLKWPERDHYKFHPIPEPVCWLGWKGALFIAGINGIYLDTPERSNENQLRILQKNLRSNGINWVREPRWSILRHDLAVIDFKFSVESEISSFPEFTLQNWKYENEFRSDPDIVTYEIKDRNGSFKHLKKRVLPDAYFEIVDEERKVKGDFHIIRFLLELDMSTHDNPSFGREKVAPGVAYIKTNEYKKRFGYNSGFWLVVTNGDMRRINNLMLQTNEIASQDGRVFFFSSISYMENGKPLTSSIWKQVGKKDPRPLLISWDA